MTNGDKIRQMSDEELAKNMLNLTDVCINRDCKDRCLDCVLEWLREEVQEDG